MTHRKVSSKSEHHAAVLARGAFFNTIALLATGLRGIFTFLVARLLGSAALGLFGVAWSSMDLLSKFTNLGLDTAATAFVAKTEGSGDRAGSRKIMKTAFTIAMSSAILLALLGSWFIWNFGTRLGQRPELVRAMAVMFFALPGVTLYGVSNALSRGMTVMHHDIYSRGLTESLGTTAALLIAIAIGAREFAPELAAIAGTLASGLLAFFLARRLFVNGKVAHASTALVPRLMRSSIPIALYDFLNIGIMHIDVIMLGWFVGRAPGVTLEALGIYTAGVQVAGTARKISQAFTPIFIPVVARQISAGHIRHAEESYGYLARWMLAMLLPVVGLFALSGGAIMTLYGSAFYRGGLWVAVVGVACAINAFVSLGETILMIDRPTINLMNSTIAFAAAIGLNLIFIPKWGPLGAALGMLVPYSIHGVLRGIQISWIFKWHWPWRALIKPWVVALMALPSALAIRLSLHGIAWELTAGAVYMIGCLIAWRIIGLDRSDHAVVDYLLKRKETVPDL
jgi:O-antigen/teichoic acid export membrane protein